MDIIKKLMMHIDKADSQSKDKFFIVIIIIIFTWSCE